MSTFQHVFMVLRGQPLHYGHKFIIDKMFHESKYVTIIFGSIQESRTAKNPFTLEERIQMLTNIYGNPQNLHVLGIADQSTDAIWLDTLQTKLSTSQENFPSAETAYCGGELEASWFADTKWQTRIFDRRKQQGNLQISASEIRYMLAQHDPLWKQYVPAENHSYLESLQQYWPKNIN